MHDNKYRNRQEAGIVLAQKLKCYANNQDVFVLALPRGGVPVAYEISSALRVPLDVFIVRKLGVPGHEELALGAIAIGEVQVLNEEIISHLRISSSVIQDVIAQEKVELRRREKMYRGNRISLNVKDRIVILVDDGIATGATMCVAVQALRKMNPTRIIVAVPVAEVDICDRIQSLVDDFVCPMRPDSLLAVGSWYEDFSQTTDADVQLLLANIKTK
jgi:putative phosphoribosyl transferase